MQTSPRPMIAHYFGIFHGASKDWFDHVVQIAPFEKCDLLILAFVRTIERNGVSVAGFLNWRDGGFQATPGDNDVDRVKTVTKTARLKNPAIKIIVSLGWGNDDVLLAASTPGPFADSVASIIADFGLDGFDIDYESSSADEAQMFALTTALRLRLPSPCVMTITPAQSYGLNREILDLFDYTMPQTYTNGGNDTTAECYADMLGSYDRIVYGLNSEWTPPDAVASRVADIIQHGAAGIFAWRLDNDGVPLQGNQPYPTFISANDIWDQMHSDALKTP